MGSLLLVEVVLIDGKQTSFTQFVKLSNDPKPCEMWRAHLLHWWGG